MTSGDTHRCICSPELEPGPTPSGRPGGLMTGPRGRVVAPASRFRPPGKRRDSTMQDTSGPTRSASSRSADLALCLGNRYRARVASLGSMLFRINWRVEATPSGRSVLAQRVSVRRTSAGDCISLPTPSGTAIEAVDLERLQERRLECKERTGNGKHTLVLPGQVARLMPVSTPTSRDGKDGACNLENVPVNALLGRQVRLLATVPTPRANDSTGAAIPPGRQGGMALKTAVLSVASGPMPNGCPPSTDNSCRLNPEYSRWLLGIPDAWSNCAPTATRSARRAPSSL